MGGKTITNGQIIQGNVSFNRLANLKKSNKGYNGMGIDRCLKCVYWSVNERCCDYIAFTGHSRGCPPNHECEVFKSKARAKINKSFGVSSAKWSEEDVSEQ